jgi:hypothetical protein
MDPIRFPQIREEACRAQAVAGITYDGTAYPMPIRFGLPAISWCVKPRNSVEQRCLTLAGAHSNGINVERKPQNLGRRAVRPCPPDC